MQLAKILGWGQGRIIIGHCAIVTVPGELGGNITRCAAISQQGVLHHHANLGPFNTVLRNGDLSLTLKTLRTFPYSSRTVLSC